MNSKPSGRNVMVPIFITVFMDMVGVGIVIPILAPLLLGSPHFFSADTGLSQRSIILGFLIASYSIAQFFGAPLLGSLSDRFGRKKVLMVSLIGTMMGYVLFAIGIQQNLLWLLFASRILDGFTGGNISIAMSAISDISDTKSRTKNFGMIGMAFGLGFVLGPYIGGKLADPAILRWFNFATPFWFAACLSVINLVMVVFQLPETLKERRNTPVSALTGFRNLSKAFKYPKLRTILFVVFLTTFGFNFFTQFFNVFLLDKFHYNQSKIGDVFAYIGIWVALGQGLITRPLSKFINPQNTLKFAILMLGLSIYMILIPDKGWYLLMTIPFIAIFQGLIQPNSTNLVSTQAGPEAQGEVLGINQSIQSVAQSIPPIIAGYIVSINRDLPITVGAICTVIAGLIFVVFFHKRGEKETKATMPEPGVLNH